MGENFKEKFKKLMEREGLDEDLPELPHYAVRYYPPTGEDLGTSFKLQEFKSRAERDKWYEKTGKAIEKVDGGRTEFFEKKG